MANNYVQLAMEETPRYEGAPGTAPYRVSTAVVYLPVTAARINAVPSHIDRGPELRNIPGDVPLVVETYSPEGALSERAYVNHLTYLLSLSGFKGTAVAGDGANATWTLTFGGTAATGGTWTVTYNAVTSGPIAFNATLAQIQAALEAMSSIGVGNVLVVQTSGGPIPINGVLTLTFRRAMGGKVITAVTASAAGLTGGAPTITPATGVAGVPPTVQSPSWVTGDTFAVSPQSFVGVGSTKWTFTKRVGAQAQTGQITCAYGDMGVWLQGQGYGISQLSLDAAGVVNADLMGLTCKSIADPGFTPTYDASSILPLVRGNLSLTWLTGGGTIDDFSFQVANPLDPVRSLGLATASLFPDIMEFGDDFPKITGSIPKRRINGTDYAALLAGTTFAALARWRTAVYVGDSTSQYATFVNMPSCQLNAGTPDDLFSRRRAGATYDFWGAYDETAGYDVQFSLVNSVSAAQLSAPFTI